VIGIFPRPVGTCRQLDPKKQTKIAVVEVERINTDISIMIARLNDHISFHDGLSGAWSKQWSQ
jgi:hypothetical protein